MNKPASIKYTPKLVLTAVLSGGLTIAVSSVYLILCLACIALRFNCNFRVTTTDPANLFWDNIYRAYIQSSSCDHQIETDEILDDLTVAILAGVTLSTSVLCLAAAITLISIVQDDSKSKFISWVAYTHVGCYVASFIVDLTTAIFFGIEFGNLTDMMALPPENATLNYLEIENLRQGAFWFMTIALKGYFPHIISCALIILLVVYLVEFQNAIKNDEHSIHKVGVLNAFDSGRKPEETWSQSDILYNNTQFMRGAQMNSGFIEDDSSLRSPRRPDPPRSDYFSSNRSYDRSDSWHHTQNNDPQGSRLFSYLDDIKRPAVKPPASPAIESDSPWRRDPWQSQTPPVPAPDYSPTQPRRLKSALKSPYM